MVLNEYLCPNCVTPWKCNGPHIPEGGDAAAATPGRAALSAPPADSAPLREALVELVASMTDKAAFQEWTQQQIAAMDRARALLRDTEGGRNG